MKQFRFLVAISIGMLVASCSSGGKHAVDGNAVVVTLSPGEDIQPLEFMDIKGWTELKTDSSGTYIRDVKRVGVLDGEYYVLDIAGTQCVLRYNESGELVNRIGAVGEGPGEYASILDFSIGQKTREIYVLTYPSTVYSYSVDGDFLGKYKLPDGAWAGISANDKGMFATTAFASASASGDSLFVQFNRQFGVEGEWIGYDRPLQSPFPLFKNFMCSFGDCTYALDNINWMLYRYDCKENLLSPLVKLDVKNPMPAEAYYDNMDFLSYQQDYSWIIDVVYAPSYFMVGYIHNSRYNVAMCDWHGNKMCDGKFMGPFPGGYAADDDMLISVISPEMYMSYWAEQDGVIKPDFEVNEDTNMLIMHWKPIVH